MTTAPSSSPKTQPSFQNSPDSPYPFRARQPRRRDDFLSRIELILKTSNNEHRTSNTEFQAFDFRRSVFIVRCSCPKSPQTADAAAHIPPAPHKIAVFENPAKASV